MSTHVVPNIEYNRQIQLENEDFKDALTVKIQACKIKDVSAFYFKVESINLTYSIAKTTKINDSFRYLVNLKPTILNKDKIQSIELSPIQLEGIEFGETTFNFESGRSAIFPIPVDALFTGVSLQIIEVNPKKLTLDEMYASFGLVKDDVISLLKAWVKAAAKSKS